MAFARTMPVGGLVFLAAFSLKAQETVDVKQGRAPSPSVRPAPLSPLTFSKRAKLYGESVYGPLTLAGAAVGAAYRQARDDPREWGQGAEGYGRRFASAYGRAVVANTIVFGVAALDHEDPRYLPSQERGVWRRARYAVHHTFVSSTDSGGTRVAISAFAGIYGAAFIANAWYPGRQADTSHALGRGTTAMGARAVGNLLREFGPDILKRLRHR